MISPFLVPMTTSDVWAMVVTVLICAGLIGRIWYVEATAEAIPWPESLRNDLYKWSREDD